MVALNRRLLLGVVALSFLAGGPALAADPLRVGLIMPFSGPAAAYGIEARQAAELAVEQINRAGGVLGGRMIELVFEDDKGTPQGAVGATQKQIAVNRVAAVIGGMGSQLALAQSSVTRNKVVYINSAAQADQITEQGIDWLFQINNTTSMNAAAFNKYIVEELKPKTVAFIGENTEFSRPLLHMLETDLKAAGITLVDASMYDIETNDFTSIITKVKARDPDLVYVADGAPARLAQFWKQARQLGGFRAEATTPGVVTPVVLAAAEGAMDGVITGDIFSTDDSSAEGQAFKDAYHAKFGGEPGKVHLVVYEAVQVLAAAFDKAGQDNDPAALAGALRANTWATPRGALHFDEKGRAHAPYFYIQKIAGQKVELMKRFDN